MSASVYNYNKRALLLTNFLVAEFRLLAVNYFDDRFGVCQQELAAKECQLVEEVCKMLGVATNDKTMSGPIINLLSITLNFSTGRIYILEERRTRLIEEITGIMKENTMTPGMASKLNGKLLFVSSHFSGRRGRSYSALLADRQYSSGAGKAPVPGLLRALAAWMEILTTSPQRRSLYDPFDGSPSDYLIFTEGSHPDRFDPEPESSPPRIRWVSFKREGKSTRVEVVFSSMVVTAQHMMEWEARATQIVMIELLGALAAMDHLALRLHGRRAILLVDSEPVESALIIGGSNKEDMKELVTIFWDIVLRNEICFFITRYPPTQIPRMDLAEGSTGNWSCVEESGRRCHRQTKCENL